MIGLAKGAWKTMIMIVTCLMLTATRHVPACEHKRSRKLRQHLLRCPPPLPPLQRLFSRRCACARACLPRLRAGACRRSPSPLPARRRGATTFGKCAGPTFADLTFTFPSPRGATALAAECPTSRTPTTMVLASAECATNWMEKESSAFHVRRLEATVLRLVEAAILQVARILVRALRYQ